MAIDFDISERMKEDLAVPERDLPETITYTVVGDPVLDPETGIITPSETDYSIACIVGAVRDHQIQAGQGLFDYGDVAFYIRNEFMESNFTNGLPRPVDYITRDSVKYNLIKWKLSPDKHLWTIWGRRAEGT